MKIPTLSRLAGRFLFICMLGASATAAQAQSVTTPPSADGEAPIQLEPFVVTATRTPTPVEKTAASITVITRADIETAGYATADEALRQLPGVTLAGNGPGQTVGVFTRGAESRHTSILVDGRRLPTAMNRYFDLAYFPLNAFERIEVARGPLSSAQGGSALGGAINFLTPRCVMPGSFDGSVTAEYGYFDHARAETVISTAGKNAYANLAASVTSDENDRPNNAFEARSSLNSFGWSITPALQLDVVAGYLDFDGGTPGSVPFASLTQQLDRKLSFLMPSLTFRPSENWTHTLTAGLATQQDAQRRTDFTYDDDKTVDSQSVGYQMDFKPLPALSLQAGVEKNWQDVEVTPAPGPGGVFGLNYARYEVSEAGFVGATYDVTDAFTILGSARRDVYEEFYGAANTWRYGATYRFAGAGTRVHASDGTAFAAPEVQNFAYSFPPVTSLEPERSRGQEVGVSQRWGGKLDTSVTAFRNEVENLVQFVGGAAQNVGRTEIRGVETTLDYRPVKTVGLSLNYTYLDAENGLTDRPLVRRPRHAFNAQATWQATSAWLVGTGLRVQMRRYDAPPYSQVEDFATVRIFSSYELRKNLLLRLRLENVFDERYAEVKDYPALPFGAYGGVEWRF
jgi:vitamin B12 transporter